jgi:hypothetical protein
MNKYYLYSKHKIILSSLIKSNNLLKNNNLLKLLLISIDYKDDLLDEIILALENNNNVNFKNEIFAVIHYSWCAFLNSLSIIFNQDIFEILSNKNYNYKSNISIYKKYGEAITLLTLNNLLLETLQSINLIKNKKLFNYFYESYYKMFMNNYKKNLVNLEEINNNLKLNLVEDLYKLKNDIITIINNYN